jgi:hypothetical protein
MIRHFFLDKTNSIVQHSYQNMGLNPVCHVGYGRELMRSLIHFDIEQIRCLIEDKTFSDVDKLRFTLKMTNCFSVDSFPYEKPLIKGNSSNAKRAASFDLMLFKLPRDFDAGRGFDFVSDFWVHDNISYSEEGSNWYYAKNGVAWITEEDIAGKIDLNDENLNWAQVKIDMLNTEGGIYNMDTLVDEYDKYLNGEESLIVATQHFDFGNENLSMDITDYVLETVNSVDNFGLCLAFIPLYENMSTEVEQYVGFFNDNTNTFFHPYVEAVYDEHIMDDRESFTIGKKNRLYLYVSDDGVPTNLDNIPSFSCEGNVSEVKQATKGVYYTEIDASKENMEEGAIYYDNWSNLALNGEKMEDVEMEFSTHPSNRKIHIGSDSYMKNEVVPSIYGINDDEKLRRNEVREVTVDFRKRYTTDKKELISSGDYRLYIKDGNREIDVIPYTPIEKSFLNNFFIVNVSDLIPNEYYIDIRVTMGREVKHFKRVLKFTVVSDVTERYQ